MKLNKFDITKSYNRVNIEKQKFQILEQIYYIEKVMNKSSQLLYKSQSFEEFES